MFEAVSDSSFILVLGLGAVATAPPGGEGESGPRDPGMEGLKLSFHSQKETVMEG